MRFTAPLSTLSSHTLSTGAIFVGNPTPPMDPTANTDEEECLDAESGQRLLTWDYMILDEGHKVCIN